jgi:uncharacterized protein
MPSRTVRDISPEALKQFHPFRNSPRESVVSSRRETAKETASSLANELKDRFNATKILLFGSVTRSDFGRSSDIDLAVWGISTANYFKAVAYASGYSNIFKIDLVDAENCQPSLLQHIIRHGVEL